MLVEFDPGRVSYEKLLHTFFDSHPTTKNRQGPDVGDQYRSAVFTFSPEQESVARASVAAEQKSYAKPITTEIRPIGEFYKAEDYHQQYDEKTGRPLVPPSTAQEGPRRRRLNTATEKSRLSSE